MRSKGIRDLPIVPLSRPAMRAMSTPKTWRVTRPVIMREKCNKCMICWLYCPEGVIRMDREGYPQINYEYCKGCNICFHECRPKAIKIEAEI